MHVAIANSQRFTASMAQSKRKEGSTVSWEDFTTMEVRKKLCYGKHFNLLQTHDGQLRKSSTSL